MNNFEAEGFNMKQGILWIDTEESDETWDEEQASIDAHLISKGYSKTGGGQFFSDRKYAWVMYRLQKYLTGVGEKIKGYRGVTEDREYLEEFYYPSVMESKIVFSPWENTSKNKVALVWQFVDSHGFLISEPYYKYFSLTNPPEWFDDKYELHIGEDYRFDKCPFCDYKNPMNTLADAVRLDKHAYSHGPIMHGNPMSSDFSIEVSDGYSDTENMTVGWGNPFGYSEVLVSSIPYSYGLDHMEDLRPTAAAKRNYQKKAKAIKAGLRAAGFKLKK